MVPVRNYKAFWEYVATQITEIKRVICVDDESELSKKIEDVADKEIILVAPYPSSDFNPLDEDNFGDVDTCVIYLLMKINVKNETEEDILTERATTQALLNEIRRLMLDLEAEWTNPTDWTRLMKQLIRGKQHIDRERNFFGCNGYSLSFGLRTNNF